MTKLQDKAQAQVKQMVGQMIGDERLVLEGKEQQQKAAQVLHEGETARDENVDAWPASATRYEKAIRMRSSSLKKGADRVFVLVLDHGEEAVKAITEFANSEKIGGASVTAIGAFSEANVGWFDLAAKKYKPIAVNEQSEVLSLIGDIAEGDDGKASLHLHAVLGLRDGTLRGGHLLSGTVQPTLEVTVTETVEHLRRKKRPDLGIALINI